LVIAFLAADLRSAIFMIAAVALCLPLAVLAKRQDRLRQAPATI
jgi:hypothetical protein